MQMMTESPRGDHKEGREQSRAIDGSDLLDMEGLIAHADEESDKTPARRTLSQVVIAAVTLVAVVILLIVVAIQGLMGLTGQSPCTGSACVELSLPELERTVGVSFPEGTSVTSSSRTKNFLNDEAIHFEVRIPAGVQAPDAPQPWQNEADSESGIPSMAKSFVKRGLKDVRWTQGGWTAGVEASGETIVSGLYLFR